jgi:NADH-quinone oxidoreductase subunit G
MAKIIVDGLEHSVDDGITIIQACESIGIQIPRFCYHEKLEIAGNCRMCLVEVEKSPKPVASCSINVTEGMVIKTESELVKKAREGVMEFLLINHPLDCPICDQGGECDLQDQAVKYGKCQSSYNEEKRAVEDKYMGPLIVTHMNRCIHCTRCVRFLEDIAGTNELGAIGRGEHMEITTYVETSIKSEMSGNIIDLCPVGALTSKPYAFTARSWELKHTYSVDVMDAVGSHIRIDTRGNEIMRILPQAFDPINEEWISDKTRFAYDGLKYQRLDTPMLGSAEKFRKIYYMDAIEKFAEILNGSESVAMIAGKLTDVETMFAAKNFLQKFGSGYSDYEIKMHGLQSELRSNYLFNSAIAGIEEADHCLLINTNPRHEAAIINARIRKSVVHNNLSVSVIGPEIDLNYPYEKLGQDTAGILIQILEGAHP